MEAPSESSPLKQRQPDEDGSIAEATAAAESLEIGSIRIRLLKVNGFKSVSFPIIIFPQLLILKQVYCTIIDTTEPRREDENAEWRCASFLFSATVAKVTSL